MQSQHLFYYGNSISILSVEYGGHPGNNTSFAHLDNLMIGVSKKMTLYDTGRVGVSAKDNIYNNDDSLRGKIEGMNILFR